MRPEKILDHKWLDPECIQNGCQSLIWKGRYESAVKGRADFRQAMKEARERIDAAVRAEREACAKIADGYTCGGCGMDGKCAAEIRARATVGKKEGM